METVHLHLTESESVGLRVKICGLCFVLECDAKASSRRKRKKKERKCGFSVF